MGSGSVDSVEQAGKVTGSLRLTTRLGSTNKHKQNVTLVAVFEMKLAFASIVNDVSTFWNF